VGVIAFGIPLGVVAQQAMTPEQRMATLVNQARQAHGLSPLAISTELTLAAVAHTRDMVVKGYMEHEAPDGSTPHKRAMRHGYFSNAPGSPWYVVEVISARTTAEAALNWLLSDRLHRGVVLRPIWREMGISYQEGGPTGHLWTIEFGCRPNVLPVIADTTSSGGVTLRLTNEECSPTGGGAQQMGKATEVMVSTRSDFSGATWEPFVSTKVVTPTGKNVFVKLRDERGRESVASTGVSGPTLTAASAIPSTSLPSAAIIPDQPKSNAPEPDASATKSKSKKSKKADNGNDNDGDATPAASEPTPPVVNGGLPSVLNGGSTPPR
jgi:hypothetical protein